MRNTNPPKDLRNFIENIPKKRADKNYNPIMQICDASKIFHDSVRHLCDSDGLASGYRMILFHLAHMDPGVTQLDLCRATHLKAPTISVALRKMEADGLITRKSNEMDLRQTLVYLSEKGREIDNRYRSIHDESAKIALSGLTKSELDTLSDMLNRIIDNLIAEETDRKDK